MKCLFCLHLCSLQPRAPPTTVLLFSKNCIIFQRTVHCLLLFPFLSSSWPKISVPFQELLSVVKPGRFTSGYLCIYNPLHCHWPCFAFCCLWLNEQRSPLIVCCPPFRYCLLKPDGSVIGAWVESRISSVLTYLWLSVLYKIQMPLMDFLGMTWFGPSLLF